MMQQGSNYKLKKRYRFVSAAGSFVRKHTLLCVLIILALVLFFLFVIQPMIERDRMMEEKIKLLEERQNKPNIFESIGSSISYGWNAFTNGVSNVWNDFIGLF